VVVEEKKKLEAGSQEPEGRLAPIVFGIMTEVGKQVLWQVLQGNADANIRFEELRTLLVALGFTERIKGSHHIFTKPEVAEILNLQPRGSLAKAYQVKQVRNVIVRYKLVNRPE
jgi:predicted RNA binding protein YcfA (HicA-like mRNA interferase family)